MTINTVSTSYDYFAYAVDCCQRERQNTVVIFCDIAATKRAQITARARQKLPYRARQ